MTRITGEITIDRPVDVVFDFVADERNEPSYNPRLRRVTQTTTGPIGRGTRFRAETVTRSGTTEMEIEYTDFQRPRRLASTSRLSTMDVEGDLTFESVPGGTRMRWSWELKPHGIVTLLRPILAGVGRRQEAKTWAGLKRHLEASESPKG
jgi:uncharacterized protein YndB with AHSA1/START domain